MWVMWGNLETAELWIYEPGKQFPDSDEHFKLIGLFDTQKDALDFRAEIRRIHEIQEDAKRDMKAFKQFLGIKEG